MEMQNVLKQMTDMLSLNVSKELFPSSLSGTTGGNFETVMSKQMSGASQKKEMSTLQEDTANTVGVQAMGGKRQQELQDVDTSMSQKEVSAEETAMQNSVAGTMEVAEQEIPEEVMETVVQWMSTMQEQICEELGITPEELEGVMSELGLQFMDLQDMSKVQQLVLQVAGEDNVTALLTNEQLNTQVQDILRITAQTGTLFADKLDVPEEEFVQLVEEVIALTNEAVDTQEVQMHTDIQEQNTETEFAVDATMLEDTMEQPDVLDQDMLAESPDVKAATEQEKVVEVQSEDVSQETTGEEMVEISQRSEEEVTETPEAPTAETVATDHPETIERQVVAADQTEKVVDEDQTEVRKSVDKEVVTVNETTETDENTIAKSADTSKKQNAPEQESGSQTSLFDQMMEQVALAKAQHVESVQEKVEIVQQMREVFEQVVEQIKVTVTADTSEMTMQLNPENLGKVNLSIVAKEGHITAQFVTETEVARQALESQLQQLRDTLGEQGLKVDKVEVSVSDFSFAQQNNTNAEEQKEQQRNEHAKQVHRNLNLSSLEEITDMTEEEELAVKIMRSNGNQIDFTA